MKRKGTALLFALILIVISLTGCRKAAPPAPIPLPAPEEIVVQTPAPVTAGTPKYIFLFIGDGMGMAQVQLAGLFDAAVQPEYKVPVMRFAEYPVQGTAQTYNAGTFVPDSASTGTAIACGIKTASYAVGVERDRKTVAPNLVEYYHDKGYKTGVISTVAINNATPAAFYAHTATRSNYYEIGRQMTRGLVDYFAGGGITSASGGDTNVFTLLKNAGYTVVDTAESIRALSPDSGKVYAVDPNARNNIMDYEIEKKENALVLADYVQKGIEMLYSESGGFFLMCESGKIDLAAHNNDAVGVVSEVKALDNAVATAYAFYEQHPTETLIVVTADHETGGLSLGTSDTGYALYPKQMHSQITSGSTADTAVKAVGTGMTEDQLKEIIVAHYGFSAPGTGGNGTTLTSDEWNDILKAYRVYTGKETMPEREKFAMYDSYNPIVQACNKIISARTGLAWGSHEHTGMPVPVFAIGAGAERFAGGLDNTDICTGLKF